MNKKKLTLILFVVPFLSNAQFTPSGGDLYHQNGNVGIGLANPLSKLHIVDGTGVLRTRDNGDGIVLTSYDHLKSIGLTSSSNGNYGGTGSVGLKLINGDIRYYFEGNEKVTFKAEGKVGIGTSNPNAQLEVWQQSGEGSIVMKSLGQGSSGAANFIVDAATGFSGRFLFRENGVNKGWIYYSGNSNVIGFRNSDHISLLNIKMDNGNVGIGTTTPDSKLTVAGKIHSQEVKVTVSAGADHVFKDDYKLPELGKLEAFIKENKHLPEIAPEREMVEKGVEVGEFQIKLLQKIEELTLYIIDQNKLLKEVMQKNKILEAQMEEMAAQ